MNETNNGAGKMVGIEVSKSWLKAVCLNAEGKLIDVHRYPIGSDQTLFSQLIKFIKEAETRFGGFDKLGVAVPGLVHHETKRVAFSTFIPEHQTIDFLGEMEAATNLKITIENDANAAGYGEFVLGAGRGNRNIFYATIGTGIGGALILDGKIWHGTSGFAGEFGQFAINSEGVKLEEVASTANIVRRTRSRFQQDSTSSLSSLDEEEIGLKDVVNAAQEGDDFAILMLDRTGKYIGTALAGVINLLNVEKIILGGSLMKAENLVLEPIIQRTKELSFAPSFEATQIIGGELGGNAAAIGVALLSAEI